MTSSRSFILHTKKIIQLSYQIFFISNLVDIKNLWMHQYIQYRMQCENQHLFYRKKCSINSIYIIYGIKKPTNLLPYTCNRQKSCNIFLSCTWVLIFCLEFRELSHLTRDLSQAEMKITVVKSWTTDKMTTVFSQKDNFNHFEWNRCHFVHLLSL